jgi:hypothetical protein
MTKLILIRGSVFVLVWQYLKKLKFRSHYVLLTLKHVSERLVCNSLLQFYKLPKECTNLHVCSLIYKTSKITVLNKIFPPINTTKEKQPVFSSRFLTPASFPWAINNSCLAQSLQCLQVPSNTTAFLGDLSLSLELC